MSEPKSDSQALAELFITPGMLQAQLVAKMVECEDLASLTIIVRGIIEQAQSDNEQDLQTMVQAQITMLNGLSATFLTKALTGYKNAETMQAVPQMLAEFVDLSLRCQAEMRKCISLLHEMRKGKKTQKSKHIKVAPHKRSNELQQEFNQQTKVNYAPVDSRSEIETGGIDKELETVGALNRG